jgi:hypothetical protein
MFIYDLLSIAVLNMCCTARPWAQPPQSLPSCVSGSLNPEPGSPKTEPTTPDTTTTPPSPPPQLPQRHHRAKGGGRWPTGTRLRGPPGTHPFSKSGSDLAQFRAVCSIGQQEVPLLTAHGPKSPGAVHEKRYTSLGKFLSTVVPGASLPPLPRFSLPSRFLSVPPTFPRCCMFGHINYYSRGLYCTLYCSSN